MFRPDDPLDPPSPVFDEPWQAQALALAAGLVRGGHITGSAWADTLGAELKNAEDRGAPDTLQTYYLAVLSALEALTEQAGISPDTRQIRRAEWEAAYLRTPHGKPVTL
ncbi:nitrile hydratase accessory protein [Pseudooceanicola sp. C21-150M6]|uniref:nitrile hydratase accessory protein n=1 Tax=Pseudooceanicola sp. C21-150M6 TaxID=3434355 RepID=UPI003D7F2056